MSALNQSKGAFLLWSNLVIHLSADDSKEWILPPRASDVKELQDGIFLQTLLYDIRLVLRLFCVYR